MDIVEQLRKYQCPENKGCNPVVEYCQCALMDSGADEIERLQKAYTDLSFKAYAGLEEKDREIERLREALKQIAERRTPYGQLPRTVETAWAEEIARSALHQKESE